MIESAFLQLSLVIIITVGLAGLMGLLKQPLIVSYLLAGILVGPEALNLVSSTDAISSLGQMGVVLLLFMVGLGLNPAIIREVGAVSLVAGLGQIVSTFIVAFLIGLALGMPAVASAYIGIGLAFSSTIVIIKLLSDKGDADALYGKIAIGILIIQDLVAIIILMGITSLTAADASIPSLVASSLLRGAGIIALLFIFNLWVLPRLITFVAHSQEYLLLFSVGWCLCIAGLFHYLKFSSEIGALIAGVMLSMSPYRHEISSRLKPLRDVFLVLFFVLLGTQVSFASISKDIVPLAIFSGFVLFLSPVIVIALMAMLGYTRRIGFLTGITLAQISEFSLILAALGVKVGHLSQDALSLMVLIGLVTIAGSSYFIIYAERIYPHLSRHLAFFERKGTKAGKYGYQKRKEGYEIILFGCNRIGYDLLEAFKRMGKAFVVVDFNPAAIEELSKEGIPCRYGDADDAELLEELSLSKVKMVASTIPSHETNLLLLEEVRKHNQKAIVIMVSHNIEHAMELYEKGATYVVIPHFLGGHYTSTLIEEYGLDLDTYLKLQAHHINNLKKRKMRGQEPPQHERG